MRRLTDQQRTALLAIGIIVVLVLLCVGISRVDTDVRLNSRPPTRTPPPPYTIYTSTLTLRDGRVLPLTCIAAHWEIDCRYTFPSGETMDYIEEGDFDWSPDGRFVMRSCVRSTHDSSCLNGAQIWDTTAGKKVKQYGPLIVYQWIPDSPHTIAFILDNYQGGPNRKLTYLDVATGQETYPTECPKFFLQYNQSAPWVAEACHLDPQSPLPYTTSFSSPDKRLIFQVDCVADQCWITTPNGKRIRNTIVNWSADYEAATMCGGEQPNPCGVLQVWDMIDGDLIKTLPSGSFHQWAPQGHTLFYVQQTVPRLMLLDTKTNAETYPDKCPDWYRPDENLSWTQKVCQ